MELTARKMTKIIDELVVFFFRVGSTGINMNLKRMEDGYVLTLKTDYDPAQRKQVEDLKKFFTAIEKNEGLEEFFWQLAGVSATGNDSEIHLIGQMVEVMKLEVTDDTVEMALYKKKKSA